MARAPPWPARQRHGGHTGDGAARDQVDPLADHQLGRHHQAGLIRDLADGRVLRRPARLDGARDEAPRGVPYSRLLISTSGRG